MPDSENPDSKVLFRVMDTDGSDYVETLWAFHLADDNYQLANSPFYAYSVSWEDIIVAPFNTDEGFPTFQRVASKSGNRTVRVFFESAGNESETILQGLVHLGCSYEGANEKYFSINIPPGIDLESIRTYLIDQHATWEHADPSYTELFPDQK